VANDWVEVRLSWRTASEGGPYTENPRCWHESQRYIKESLH